METKTKLTAQQRLSVLVGAVWLLAVGLGAQGTAIAQGHLAGARQKADNRTAGRRAGGGLVRQIGGPRLRPAQRFVIGLPDPKKYGRAQRLEQAERQRWRALLLVIKAKLESVENTIETFEQAFLANIVLPNDKTVADTFAPAIAAAYKDGKMPKALMPAEGEK